MHWHWSLRLVEVESAAHVTHVSITTIRWADDVWSLLDDKRSAIIKFWDDLLLSYSNIWLISLFRDFPEAWIHHCALDCQELTELGYTVLISCTFQRTWTESLLLKQLNGMFRAARNPRVEQVRCADNPSPSLSCMAVNKNSLSFFLYEVLHLLAYHQDLLGIRSLQVLPVVVKVCDFFVVEAFRVVWKPNLVIDAVATRWMFSRLL